MSANLKVTDQEIINAYNKTHNIWKAGKMLGICGQSVHERLVKLKVKLNNRPFTENDFKILKEFYQTHSLKRGSGELQELATKLGRTKQFISRKAKQLGLTENNRPRTEEKIKEQNIKVKEYLRINGHPKGMLGKHHTIETKEHLKQTSSNYFNGLTEDQKIERNKKILKTRYENEIKNNNPRTLSRIKASWKQGYRTVGNKRIFFRSSWEYNYSLFLQYQKENNLIKDWFYEAEIFYFDKVKSGCVAYKPDFKIIKNDESFYFVEIKGWMDQASKTKIKRMAKYYPEIKLVVIDNDSYKKIKNEWAYKLKGWEFRKV